MAFSTYNEVIDYIRLELAQPSAPVADWFVFAEAELSGIRHYRMEKRLVIAMAANSGRIALPADFIELRSITMDGTPLRLVSAKQQAPLDQRSYYVTGHSLYVNPLTAASERLVVTYYARPPALTLANPTNWLLEFYPQVYRHALLIQGHQFYRDVEAENASRGRLGEALALLDRDNRRARSSGNTMVLP